MCVMSLLFKDLFNNSVNCFQCFNKLQKVKKVFSINSFQFFLTINDMSLLNVTLKSSIIGLFLIYIFMSL